MKQYAKKVELTPSNDNAKLSDSIITYSAARNAFTYLKSGSAAAPGTALLRCQITTTPVQLTENIHLGMNKADLKKVLGKPFSTDVVVASEEEGYQKFYFTFKDGGLQTLKFQSDYID